MDNKIIKNRSTTAEILEDVVKKTFTDKILVGDLIKAMDSGSFGLIMTIFSLPIIIPLPPPFPSLIAIPLLIFSFQMMIGCGSPKLPRIFANFAINRTLLATVVEKSAPYIRKADAIIKPRFRLFSSGLFVRIIGLCCFIFSISILFPLPLTNLLPGLGVLITSFGLLGRDGIIILLGLTIGAFGVMMTTIAIFFGVEAIGVVKDFVLGSLF